MDIRLIFRNCLFPSKTEGGTQRVSPGAKWLQTRMKRGLDRQIRQAVCQENPLRRGKASVPQTDTGGRVEYTKALG
jgi:hypothetical protein